MKLFGEMLGKRLPLDIHPYILLKHLIAPAGRELQTYWIRYLYSFNRKSKYTKNTVRAIRWICDCVSLYSNMGYAYFPFWCLLRHIAGKIAFSCLFTHQYTPQKAKVCVWLFKTLLLLWTRLVPLEKHSPHPHPPLEKTSELFMQKSVCVVGRVGGGCAMPPTNPIEMHWLFIYIHTFFNKNVN